jgi:hypothetical protein
MDFFSFPEMGPLCAAQVGLELTILLPQPSYCWDYRHEPPHQACIEGFYCCFGFLAVLGFELRASGLQSRHSIA